MNSDLSFPEQIALAGAKNRYEKSGYEFFVEPAPDKLPSFLEGVRPDAIAIKGDEGVVIEVNSPDTAVAKSAIVGFLASEVPKHKGWNFELLLAESAAIDVQPTREEILVELLHASHLVEEGYSKAAVLFAWGLLEAAARLALRDVMQNGSKHHTPKAVVEQLVSHGLIDDGTGEVLLQASRIRNSIAHGMISAPVPRYILEVLIQAVENLLAETSWDGFHEQ